MNYKNLIDMHIHTDNSPDGAHSTMLMAQSAQKAGIRVAAITDHCECNEYYSRQFNLSAKQAVFEAYKAKAAFAGEMVVLSGIELGQPLSDIDAAADVLKNKLDFVLASLHTFSDDAHDFYFLDYNLEENEPYKLFSHYLEEVNRIVDWGGFDSLAHLTYPLRYIVGNGRIDFDLLRYFPEISEILKKLVENNKSLEINTSGLRQVYGKLLPDIEIIKLFKSLGGENITIGSDAHRAGDVGKNIIDGYAAAVEAGFKYITIYQNRQPIHIPIE